MMTGCGTLLPAFSMPSSSFSENDFLVGDSRLGIAGHVWLPVS